MIAEFAQIVGLLSAFLSGRQVNEVLRLQEFMKWLNEHNHEELRKSIEQSQVTTIGIKALLSGGVEQIQHKLDYLSEQITQLATHVEGVKDLATEFTKETLSEQSVEILQAMEKSQTEYFIVAKVMGPYPHTLVFSTGENLEYSESQFLEADLALLVSLGLLLQKSNNSGEPVYYFTRPASAFVKELEH